LNHVAVLRKQTAFTSLGRSSRLAGRIIGSTSAHRASLGRLDTAAHGDRLRYGGQASTSAPLSIDSGAR
jgi:hypothetical protein